MTSSAASSRILVLSSSPDQARQFVERVKALSDSYSQHLTDPEHPQSTVSSSDAGSDSIPWTIVNRYYTAEVHFETRTLLDFRPIHASEVPAVIYVWNQGEKYQEDVPSLASRLQNHDPEVSLAVRFTGDGTPHADKDEDEEGLDEFLSSHGFEYVDGELAGRKPTGDGAGFSDESSSGIPGLPRVLDALSTIMWPNLVQSETTRNRKSRARELLDWARTEEENDGLQALVASPASEADADAKKKSRMQREMEELERWLEQGDHNIEKKREEDDLQAWKSAEEANIWHDIPTPTIRTPHGEEFGFDDDFDDFVGAPMDVSYGHERQDNADPIERLVPMHTGTSYRSLSSDLGNASPEPHGYDTLDEDDHDPDLPSRQEIEQATKRIFGAQLDDTPPHTGSSTQPQRSSTLASDISFESGTSDGDGVGGEDDFNFGAFDLSRVLSALQGMKEEISGITDESERRKAAAKVALGLVYGLQKEDARVGEDVQ
ncbi:hypothetical protein QCA50_007031 [Cerrena zonata]|uniref:Uncharacterized protein n=1 Tax=Cerrena zonata TaxID=2478898 RepID=A0AAW0GAB6_9APHY